MSDDMLRSIRREQMEQSTKGANQNFCFECGAVINAKAELCPKCGGKNRLAATLFALILGGLGIHKFYLGQVGWGIIYLLFCWTFVPAIIGFIEGIVYLTMTDESFNAKYG
jgi:TM2 domain-containing membrane protein YozV